MLNHFLPLAQVDRFLPAPHNNDGEQSLIFGAMCLSTNNASVALEYFIKSTVDENIASVICFNVVRTTNIIREVDGCCPDRGN